MKLTFTLIAAYFSISLMGQQRPGTPDNSFGTNGKVQSVFNIYSTAESVMVENDQKIIVVGDCSVGGIAVRYNTNGSIDSSFGNNGIFITEALLSGLKVTGALDQNEKIVLAGTYNNELRTVRLLNNGQIDSSFGKNGIASISNKKSFKVESVAIDEDGKVVVAASDYYNGIVAGRWLNNGTPDSSLGTAGISAAVTSYDFTQANTIAITPGNKIVVAGALFGEYTSFITIRFLSNGLLDTSFNKTGFNIDPLNEYESIFYPEGAYSCAIQPDGKTIVAGTSTLNSLHGIGFVLIRYNIDGSPDKTFAAGGVLQLNVNNGPSACNAIVLQKDGEILAAGAQGTNFLLTRFTSSGFTDTTFGVTNYTTSTDFGGDEAPYAIALQVNGKIVLAGGAANHYPVSNILIARYYNDSLSKKQIIVQKIKHYIQTHNAQATTLNNISAYPNPVQNVLHVEGLPSSQNTKLTVVDFNGRIAVSRELRAVSGVYDLNIASLHAGNYLLKIEMNGEVVTKQFVKE